MTTAISLAMAMNKLGFDNLPYGSIKKTDLRPPSVLLTAEDDPNISYQVIRELGAGSFGVVEEVLTPKKVDHAALKIFFTEGGKERAREIDMLRRVKDAPHVIQFLENFKLSHLYYRNRRGELCVNPNDNGIHSDAIMTRVIPCANIYEMYMKPLQDDEVNDLLAADLLKIGKQGLEALSYFHQHDILYLDVKPDNLIYYQGALYFCDFGLSRLTDAIDFNKFVGTFQYRAPEQFFRMPYDGRVDVWALAVSIIEMYIGYPLLDVEGSERAEQTVVDFLHLLTIVIGPLGREFARSVPSRFSHYLKEDGSIAIKPSKAGQAQIDCYTEVAKWGPPIAIWEKCIQIAADKKGDSPETVEKLIAFLEPMLRYQFRHTSEEALKFFDPPTPEEKS